MNAPIFGNNNQVDMNAPIFGNNNQVNMNTPIFGNNNQIDNNMKEPLISNSQNAINNSINKDNYSINNDEITNAIYDLSLPETNLTYGIRKGNPYVNKEKDGADERNIVITLTDEGEKLQENALCIPETIAKEFDLPPEEAALLYQILYKLLDQERNKNTR